MKPGLIDEALPGVAAVVTERNVSAARNAAQRIALRIAEAIHHGTVRIADRGADPDVPIFVFELDVISVSIPEDAGFAFFFFQVKEAAGQLLSFSELGVDHCGRGYYRIYYVADKRVRR